MAIPKIKEYSICNEVKTVVNKVSWLPNAHESILLIHDMQDYFVKFYNPKAEPISSVINNIKNLKERCKSLNIPVVYSAQPCDQSPEDRALLTDFWGNGLKKELNQEGILNEIKPDEDDRVYTKWRYSAFQKTDMLEFMRREGKTQIIICGIYAHIGILSTSLEAFMSDIKPFVVADAVADFSTKEHNMALEYISQRCGNVLTLNELNNIFEVQAPVQTLCLESMRKDVADSLVIPINDILLDDNLMDFGLDSIRMMILISKWHEQGANIRFDELAEAATLNEWWEMIKPTLKKNNVYAQTTNS